MISTRARDVLSSSSPLVEGMRAAQTNPYDKTTNQGGIINLGTAQSFLLGDILKPKLLSSRNLPEDSFHYVPIRGVTIDPENLCVAAGAGAVLDLLFFTLCNEGDGVIVPTPYYGGFDFDLQQRALAKIIEAPLHAPQFELVVEQLDAALHRARQQGTTVKAVLVTNPHNPTGVVYSDEQRWSSDSYQMRGVAMFANRHGLHLVVDEVYANSVYGRSARFESAISSVSDVIDPLLLHVVYSMSKDFGVSGFRVGVIWTRNQDVLSMFDNNFFSTVSSDTQYMLATALSDRAWCETLFEINELRLRGAHELMTESLDELGIRYSKASAGFFIWADLSNKLQQLYGEVSFETEKTLWKRLIDIGLYILPGFAFHMSTPGWFRVCFAQDSETLRLAMSRLSSVLRENKELP